MVIPLNKRNYEKTKGEKMEKENLMNIDIDIDWLWVLIIGFIIYWINYNNNNRDVEMAKAGLEQCVISVNTDEALIHNKTTTIWTKDCKELLKNNKGQ
jgi:hypothetical protein